MWVEGENVNVNDVEGLKKDARLPQCRENLGVCVCVCVCACTCVRVRGIVVKEKYPWS